MTIELSNYAAPVWHPGLNKTQSALFELIQRPAMKTIFSGIPHEDAIHRADITTLKGRTFMFPIIQTHRKVVIGLIICCRLQELSIMTSNENK